MKTRLGRVVFLMRFVLSLIGLVAVTAVAYAVPPTITAQPQITSFSLTSIYSFTAGNDGANPQASLIQGSDGRLYGTAPNGGATGNGTVFAVNPGGTGFVTLYSFTGGNDGAYPEASLIQGNDGRLYGTTIAGGASGKGTVFAVNPDGTGFAALHSFTGGNDGAYPQASLIQGSDGRLYGTANQGGATGNGAVFAVNPDGTGFATLYSFMAGNDSASPQASLVQGSDGRLYGTATYGGANGNGAVFAVNPDGTGYATLYSFIGGNDGGNPQASLIQGSDGRLYGTAPFGGTSGNGTVFAINPDGTGLATLYSFTGGNDGALPFGGLIQGSDGRLYGTVNQGGVTGNGTVFALNPDGTGYATLYGFTDGNDGANPQASLIQGTDGRLYGTANQGGAFNNGTLFAISSQSVNEGNTATITVAATGTAPLSYQWQFNGVNIAGATSATFTLTNASASNAGSYTVVISNSDGSVTSTAAVLTVILPPPPSAPVFSPAAGTYYYVAAQPVNILSVGATAIYYTTNGSTPTTGSTLYTGSVSISTTTTLRAIGVNASGSSPVTSATYTIIPPAASLNILYNFTGSNSGGCYPGAALVQGSDGNFYGTTEDGGSGSKGTVFKVTPAGNLTSLVSFAGSNVQPTGALVQGSDGNFYGATYAGNTIFKMTPAGVLTTLVSFDGANGAGPTGSLVQGSDGNFYGTTVNGGSSNGGIIFKMTPAGVLTTLVSFPGANGTLPLEFPSALVQGSDGNFYGTTGGGGSGGKGSVFKMTPAGVLTTLVSFVGSNGAYPSGALVQGSDGNFYGTTEHGGSSDGGTVFRITPAGVLTTLVSFNSALLPMAANGASPYGGLVQGSDGNFYGTTYYGGGDNDGTIFVITPSGALTTLAAFDGANGTNPLLRLVQGSDGNFYGTTTTGGSSNQGVFFQLVLPPPPLAPVFNSAGGTYTSAQSVTITSVGATAIYYTTNGSTPNSSSPLYSGPVLISANATLQAIGVNSTGSSAVTSGTYTINIPPFTNTSVPGMQLWLKADTIPSAGPVGIWQDQSGNNNNATQGNPSSQPTLIANSVNSLPVVHFNGSQVLGLPNFMNGAGAGEVFAVVRTTVASGTTNGLWGWGGGYGSLYPNSDGTVSEDFGTNTWQSLGQPAANLTQYNLYSISSSAAEWTQRFNGLVSYDRAGNMVSFRAYPTLGADNAYGLESFTGDIAEIIVCNTVLTPAQRDTVSAYLGNKYNLYTAPPVPASLVATPLSPDQVSLQWSAPPRSDHVDYLIERSTDGVNFMQVPVVADGLSYIDTGLTAGTNYTYRVRAQGYAGTSGYSNLALATTPSSGTDLPLNMQLWLKADTISSASPVGTWKDQSGEGNNAFQGTPANEPTLVPNSVNSLPVVHFNGSQVLGLPNFMNGAGAGEIFAVVRSTVASGTTNGLWGWGGSNGSLYPNSDGTVWEDFGTSVWQSLGQPAANLTQYNIYSISSSAAEWTQRFNGLVSYDHAGNMVSFRASPTLGADNAYGQGSFTGDIAEIIVYNTVLTQAQRDTISAYLGSKYNLYTAPPVAAPVFSVAAGAYDNVQAVTITSATTGATIRYTTDGSTPSEIIGTVYTGAPVNISSATTLQAIAYESGFADSAVTSSAYTLQIAPLVFNPAPGTYANAPSVTITSATNGVTIRYTTDGRIPNEIAGTIYTGAPVNISSTATLQAIAYESGFTPDSRATGTYSLQTAAPVASLPAGTYANAQAVTLTSATSGATISYTTDGSTPSEINGTVYTGAPVNISSATTLQAIAYESGFADSSVVSNSYIIGIPQVAAPVFSPAPGQAVTMTTATSGATIRYTTNGSAPSETNGTIYTGAPVNISSAPTMFQAIAYKSGLTDSTVTSATVGMPTITIITPANGSTIGN